MGKCYFFENCFEVGFDDIGCILVIYMDINGNCGYLFDLFDVIVDCVMFYVDNGYYLGVSYIVGYCLKINMVFYIVY